MYKQDQPQQEENLEMTPKADEIKEKLSQSRKELTK
jgi:hypothetical protein